MHDENEVKLLSEILPHVAAQLRGSLGNMRAAVDHLVPEQEGGTGEKELAIFQQSYYRMMRLTTNLASAPMLLETELFATRNVEWVAWLDELCRQAQPLAEEAGVTLTFSCQMRAHVALAHPAHMERLVWNLLSNAMKFTPRGGSVTVTLRSSGKQLLLSVSDTGCGISEELQETVFDRYLHTQRMDPLPHGLGLGLPLCRRIAEGHGGRLVLQSAEGKGTTVTVALPDKRGSEDTLRDIPYHYAGGFQSVLMELSDALPYKAFRSRHID